MHANDVAQAARYREEGVDVETIKYSDNIAVVELIAGRADSLMGALTEECIFPKGSDGSYAEKVKKVHSRHAHFNDMKTEPTAFAVRHFAGEVVYEVDGFLAKNKDPISQACCSAAAITTASSFTAPPPPRPPVPATAHLAGPARVAATLGRRVALIADERTPKGRRRRRQQPVGKRRRGVVEAQGARQAEGAEECEVRRRGRPFPGMMHTPRNSAQFCAIL